YIQTLIADGQIGKAQNLAEQLYSELTIGTYEDHREKCYACIVSILSKIYEELNDIDLAIDFAKKSLHTTDELIDYVGMYERLSELYLKKEDYKTALQYKDSLVKAKDSLSSVMNR